MGFVRHTAGRTLLAVMSPKGNGTRTILPLVMKRFAIGDGVNVFGGILQKIKSRTVGGGFCPSGFRDDRHLRHQNNDADATLAGDGQRLIELQLVLCIHNPGSFNRIHDQNNVAVYLQKTNNFSEHQNCFTGADFLGRHTPPFSAFDLRGGEI